MNEIRLTEEMFISLMQGKKLQYVTHHATGKSTTEWVIYPPHHGLYFTHAQIAEVQNVARMEGSLQLIELLEKMIRPANT